MITLLVLPIVLAVVAALFSKRITAHELGLQLGIQFVVGLMFFGIAFLHTAYDTETWSSVVSDKVRDEVSCRHGYPCNCRQECSGDGKDRSCWQVCDTCYEHDYDVDWNVNSKIGSWSIDTIDSQGLKEPPRWTEVKVADPVVSLRSYTNYIKASPGTLFRGQGLLEKYKGTIPDYPQQVYDYYKIDRFVSVGFSAADVGEWNKDLMILNGSLGAAKQVNIIVVAVLGQPREWAYALRESWIGGKKNDAIVVLGIDGKDKIEWAEIVSWDRNPIFQITLRDRLQGIVLRREEVIQEIQKAVSDFYVRKPMAEYSYLKYMIQPDPKLLIALLVMSLLTSAGLSAWMHRDDVV